VFIAGSGRTRDDAASLGTGRGFERSKTMTRFGKLAIGALLMAGTAVGATAALTTPASAGVYVGVGVPYPGYYGGYYGYPYYGYPY
jgi:hypothetical protein